MGTDRFAPRTQLSRRNVLQGLGIGAAGFGVSGIAAGCSKSDKAAGSGGEFHGAYPYDAPPKGHYNLIGKVSGSINIGFYFDLIMLPGGTYLWADKKWYHLLADESSKMSADGKTFTYKVREGLKWNDGKPITAQDVYSTWLCRWAMNHAVFTYVDDFEKTDDMTVTFHVRKPASVVEYYLMREGMFSDAVYGKFAKKAEKLMKSGGKPTDKQATELTQEITKFRPKKVTVSGPLDFDYDSVTNGRLTLVKNPKGYKADAVKFDTFIIYNGEATEIAPTVAGKKIDYATHGFAVPAEKQFVSAGMRILRPPTYSGPALYFNVAKRKELADERVRQAFASAIDRDQNGRVTQAESGKGVKYMAGFSDVEVPDWMTKEGIDKLDRYPHDRERAASLLKEAGWTKRGKHWVTPQGKPAKYDLLTIAEFADYPTSAQNAATQLRAFGIQITVRGEQSTQELTDINAGKFDIGMQGWGSSSNPFPYASFRAAFLDHNSQTDESEPGMGFDLKQDTESEGTIDLLGATTESGLSVDLEKQKKDITTVARAYNELLPSMPLYERYGNNPVLEGVRVTGWPDDDDPIYKNSPYADCFTTILLYKGTLHPPASS